MRNGQSGSFINQAVRAVSNAARAAGRFAAACFRSAVAALKRFFGFIGSVVKNPTILSESTRRQKQREFEAQVDPEAAAFTDQVKPGPAAFPKRGRGAKEAPILMDESIPVYAQHLSIFKPREKKPNFVIGVILTTVKLFLVAVFMLAAGVFGLLWGIAKAYMETTPTLDTKKIEQQAVNSHIYDVNGRLITVFTGTENREWASLEEIPEVLRNAYIAVEDIRFIYHNGIDVKRIFGVFINNILNENVQGGSTITQQLIKNRLLTTEQTYKRKIQEAFLAMQLEETYSKDDILEAYLNTIPLGGANYGVKTAVKDYFNKELKDLTLREAACIAGMTQSPYKYNPRRAYHVTKDTGPLDDRIEFVLKKMYQAGFITREEYEAARNDTLVVAEESAAGTLYDYPYFVEYAVNDVITHLLLQRNQQDTKANRLAIENEIRTNGYRIYTTLDPEIQKTVQDTLSKYKSYPKMSDSSDAVIRYNNTDGSVTEVKQPQSAAVVFDYHTGELKAIIGGRDEPEVKKALNRAYQTSMPVGSSIKPISVYAPAIDKGYSPGTVVENVPVKIPGWNTSKGYPSTPSKTYGPVTLRKGLVSSLNIATARALMDLVGINESVQYLVQLGVDPSHINPDGPGLALGTSGITPVEMAVAFGAIANKGEYIEPLSFRKVEDRYGNVILDADDIRIKRQVFEPSTAWLVTDMLVNAVKSGTGTRAKIKDMTVGGKTGTNQDNKGVCFTGITPYYSASLWIGHDKYKPLSGSASAARTAAPLWQSFMAKLHKGLENKKIIEDSPESLGLVQRTVCSVSGLLATDACKLDVDGHKPVKEWFVKGYEPTEKCDWHAVFKMDTQTGKLAGPYCPAELVKEVALVFPSADSPLWQYKKLNNGLKIPAGTLPEEITPDNPEFAKLFCPLHTEEWYNDYIRRPQAIASAQQVIEEVKNLMYVHTLQLTEGQKTLLNNEIAALEALIADPNATALQIETQAQRLADLADPIFSAFG